MSTRSSARHALPSSTSAVNTASTRRTGWLRRSLALLLAGLLALVGAIGGASTALAAPDNTLLLTLPNPSTHNGFPVYAADTEYPITVGYGSMENGYEAVLLIPEGLEISPEAFTVPAGNTAVKAIVAVPGGIKIVFNDPFPPEISQGELGFKVKRTPGGETSVKKDLEWSLGGEKTTQTVVFPTKTDVPAVVTKQENKSAGWADLGKYVEVANGVISLSPALADAKIPYTVVASSVSAGPITIADTLGAGLVLDSASFKASLETWDVDGLNRTVSTPVAPSGSGTSFSTIVDLPANSKYTLTYSASIDPAQIDAIRADLQAQYDAAQLRPGGGNTSVSFGNTAVIAGSTKTASTQLNGPRAPGVSVPDLNQAFAKAASVSNVNVAPAADGTLDPVVSVDYTLTADLTQWDGTNVHRTLTADVIVTDTLPAQASWSTGEGTFLAVTEMARPLLSRRSLERRARSASRLLGRRCGSTWGRTPPGTSSWPSPPGVRFPDCRLAGRICRGRLPTQLRTPRPLPTASASR